jgi:hypothetical protein
MNRAFILDMMGLALMGLSIHAGPDLLNLNTGISGRQFAHGGQAMGSANESACHRPTAIGD